MEKPFSEILSPITKEEFRQKYYTQKSILIKSEGKKFDWLFSWSSLNQILNQSFFPHPTMKLVLEGRPINDISEKAKVLDWCRKGATVIIDQLQNYNFQVRNAIDSISQEIGEPINANLYFSQPGSQAFNVHYDHHDVIILQIEGQKQWKVYEDSEDTKFPLFVQKNHSTEMPNDPIIDCLLSSGDVLYIPRGHWHAAKAKNEQSLHITIGIDARTGIDFMRWLTNELRDDISFRECFPLVFDDEVNKQEYYHNLHFKHFDKLRSLLIEKLNKNSIFDNYARYYLATSKSFEEFYFPYSTDTSNLCLSSSSLFQRYENQEFFIESDEQKVVTTLNIQKQCHRFSAEVEPILKFIFSRIEFTFQECLQVSELSEVDVATILKHLLKESLIKII
jgi:ribosomal protein L16 Arg81 hydroxylase